MTLAAPNTRSAFWVWILLQRGYAAKIRSGDFQLTGNVSMVLDSSSP